jgi:hypothetical protein
MDNTPIIQIDRPPKDIPKEAWAKFKSENFWNVAKIAVKGDDAYIVMTGSGMKRRVFSIPNYKETTELAINAAISEGVDYDGAYPLGRNFQDCLGWLCQHGMRIGYIQPCICWTPR